MSFIVRMVHPEHGATHVYEQNELERHEKLGWHVEAKETPAPDVPVETKKRGRPKKVAA